MFPKRLLTLTLFAALAAMPTCALRAQWMPVGPEGGSILRLAEMGRYTFAGTTGGTLYRSSNDGASWSQVLGTTNTEMEGIAISGSTVFVASDSLYISNDSGSTWTVRNYPDGYSNPQGLLAVLGDYLILASREDLYLTSDQGITWETIHQAPTTSNCLVVKDGNIYVGGVSLIHSNDSGKTWTDDSLADRIQSIASEGNNIFAGSDYRDKIYRSTDNGITWDTTSIGLPPIGSQGPYEVITSLYQDSSILFAGTPFGLFRSLDIGTSWTKVSSMQGLSFIRSGDYLLAGTVTEGIVRSTDHGLHWISSNTGLRAQQITSFASIGTHLFVGVSGKGIYRSDDSGTIFLPTNRGIDSQNVGQIIAADTMLFAFTSGILFVSSNLGDSWHSTHDSVFTPAVTIGSSLIAVNTNRSLVLSSNGGVTWIERGNADPIVSLASNGSELFACCGYSDCSHYVVSSSDSGLTWNLAAGTDCTYLYSVASYGDYLFAGAGPAYASGGGGLLQWKKTDSGWTYTYPSSFPDVPIDDYATNSITSSKSDIFFSTAEAIDRFGGEGIGVFLSTDYGDTWSTFNEGLTALIVPQLFIFPPYIFAGTQSASVWRRPLSDFGISSVAQKPAVIQPEIQIFPNPFPQSTEIIFTSPSAGYAEVSIVNMLGVEVAQLFSGELSAGEHNFTWDAAKMAAPRGMYECVLHMNGQVETLPILLLR